MQPLTVTVQSAATPEALWDVLTDWPGQHRWIPFTSVEVLSGTGQAVGDAVRAVSRPGPGRRRLGLVDRMRITRYVPAHLLAVDHLGPQFRGWGEFRLVVTGAGTAVSCTEQVTGPALVARAAGLGAPVMESVLRRSLQTLSEVALQEAARRAVGGPADARARSGR